jgi:poly(3-hydroxybutyrate) depolymerase
MSHVTADRCAKGGRALPVLVMHGTSDSIIPFALVPPEIKLWTTRDGCREAPDVTYLADTDPNDGTRTRFEHYTECSDGSEVGHTSRDFDAALVIWDFFERHALP